MPYLTVKASPRVHQITLEEILTCTVPASALYDPDFNTANTVTRFIPDENLMKRTQFLEQFDFDGMVGKLKWFCEAYSHLYEVDRKSMYTRFYEPKKKGGFRPIDAPDPELKEALRVLKSIFEVKIKPLYHTCAFGYVPKRSRKDAAKKHTQNESNWNLDIDFSNFFGSTTPEFLYSSLIKVFPFSEIAKKEDGRMYLQKALDLCFLDGGLPQGTPISPLLTNIMMIPIDHMLAKMCREKKMQGKYFVYTRYADDIRFSCKYGFLYTEVVKEVEGVLKRFGAPFRIKDEKTHYHSSYGSNWYLGQMLSEGKYITIGHRNKKKYRAMIHNFVLDYMNGKRWDPFDCQVLLGKLNDWRNTEPEYIDAYNKKVNEKFNCDVVQMIKDGCIGRQDF